MPYSYIVEKRIVHVRWQGVIGEGDLQSFGTDMPRVGRQLGFAPDVIHTFEAATELGFDPAAAYQYSVRQKQVEIPNPIRAAIVVASKENEYIATVFTMLNRATNLEMKVFFDEAEARRWLARE